MPIPERFRAPCHFCKQDLDIRALGVHQYVEGWVKQRSAGGGHGISLPVRQDRWAHGYCVDRVSNGTFEQPTLI